MVDDLKKAAADQALGNNPYLQDLPPAVLDYAKGLQQNPPTAQPKVMGSHETKYGPPGSGYLPYPPGQQPTLYDFAKSLTPQQVPNPQSTATPTPQQQPLPQPKPVAPQISPQRQAFNEEDVVRQHRQETLNAQEESVRKQQEILRQGETLAQDQLKKANMADLFSAQQIKDLNQSAMKNAQIRDQELDKQAQIMYNSKVDPEHWFKEKGTAGSILAAIAIGAGAFAAAMPHTGNHENQALGIINQAIDRDVEAQKELLDRRWKMLNFQGSENEKKFVKDQWMINQMNEARRMDMNSAMQLVAQTRMSTNNQSAIQGMDAIAAGIQQQKDDLKVESIRQRLQVSLQEHAAAAAAANANPFSVQNTQKAYMKYRADAEKANLDHPDKPVPIMSMGQWLPTYQGQGMEMPKGGTGTKEQEGLDIAKQAGQNASQANIMSWLAGNVPGGQYVAPNRAKQEQDRVAYNESLLPGLIRAAGERVDHATLVQMADKFKLNPWDTDAMAQQKVQQAQDFMRGTLGLRGKGPGAAPDTSVPGATPVGE